MPAQMKPVPDAKPTPEPADETVRVSRANAEARCAHARGLRQRDPVWPFTDGALYQVYAAVGRVTVIALQPGEELVTVAAGDTVRWIVGDTSSGSADALRVNVMVKPIRSGLKTNLVITTSRRTYLLELTSTEKTWMASVSWEYPKDKMLALQRRAAASAAAPVDAGLSLRRSGSAMRSAAAIRLGSRCAPSMTARRSISSFRRASPKANCRRCSSSAPRAMGNSSITASGRRTTSWIACSAPPNYAWRGQGRCGADRTYRWHAEELSMSGTIPLTLRRRRARSRPRRWRCAPSRARSHA